jgi:dTDP-4-amino-4,6-dideoxygalactose transaminase
MDAIWAIAGRHGLRVVEDAAHAVGSHYHGVPIGSSTPAGGMRSDAIVYSFYATKNLTTGEGGMVVTHDRQLYERMRTLCLHGISRDAWNRYSDRGSWHYDVEACGFKYNLSDIQAAIGIHQLRKQEQFIQARSHAATLYNSAFEDVGELEAPFDDPSCRHSWHLYGLRLRTDRLSITRGDFIQALRARNIGASVHFIPVPMLSFFAEHAARPCNACPNALALYPRLVSLPLYPAMSEAQVLYVARAVKDIVAAARRSSTTAVPREVAQA